MCPSHGYANVKLRAHANFRKSIQDGEAGQDQVFYKLGDIQPFINWKTRAKGSSLNFPINLELLVIRQDLTRKRNKFLILADGGYRLYITETYTRKTLIES